MLSLGLHLNRRRIRLVAEFSVHAVDLSLVCMYRGKIALAVASSGIASLLLQGGRTAHSQFKIPLEPDATSTCNISRDSQLAKLIKATKLIIWEWVYNLRMTVGLRSA